MITFDLNRLSIKPKYKVLDVGCGLGRHMSAIYDFKDIVIIGIDICFTDLIEAKKRMKFHDKLSGNVSKKWGLIKSDIIKLPFIDNYFDLIICSEVLEHIDNHKEAVKELVRVLKPGNKLVVSVPSYFPEKICWILSSKYYSNNRNQKHVRIYRKYELISLLKIFNLSFIDSHYSHSLHTPYWWLKCIIGIDVNNSILINTYHAFLVWDIMKKPVVIRLIERILNPCLGKSIVIYMIKNK